MRADEASEAGLSSSLSSHASEALKAKGARRGSQLEDHEAPQRGIGNGRYRFGLGIIGIESS